MAESHIHTAINRGKYAAPDAIAAAGRGSVAPAPGGTAAAGRGSVAAAPGGTGAGPRGGGGVWRPRGGGAGECGARAGQYRRGGARALARVPESRTPAPPVCAAR